MSENSIASFLEDWEASASILPFQGRRPLSSDLISSPALPNAKALQAHTFRSPSQVDEGAPIVCKSAKPLRDNRVTLWRFAVIDPNSSGSSSFRVGMSSDSPSGSSELAQKWPSISQSSSGDLAADDSILHSSWAKDFQSGSVVDWFIERKDDIVNVYPVVDGQSQGHAFTLDFTARPELIQKLRPSLLLKENAKVHLIEFESVPLVACKEASYRKAAVTSPEGQWEALDNSLSLDANPIIFHVLPHRVSVTLGNTLSAAAEFRPDQSAEVAPVGGIFSTQKFILDPDVRELEERWKNFMPNINKWGINDDDQLVLNDAFYFKPHSARPGPFRTNIFLDFASNFLSLSKN